MHQKIWRGCWNPRQTVKSATSTHGVRLKNSSIISPNSTSSSKSAHLEGRLRDLPVTSIQQSLRDGSLTLAVEPFTVAFRSDIVGVAQALALLYGDYRMVAPDYADFHIGVRRARDHRRWLKAQAFFDFDGQTPFFPLPLAHAYPLLEWGFNWCIGTHAHAYLIFHAAVVERHGKAFVLPGEPGAGKSTLTAALTAAGYRLLSDELTMLATATGQIVPVPRPISLKNASIDIVRRRIPDAVLSELAYETSKGTVAHLQPPAASIAAAGCNAAPGYIVFPRYSAGSETQFTPVGKAETLLRLLEQAFNFHVLGERGFALARDLVQASSCFELTYSNLDEAIERLSALS